ncbi:MAG: biotin--[acetyl-CoA-carboxylase] ligase [Peptoniphilus sp.]|nr:biotin--[acetyl-CoA-carboxylase] ligase [Peptoniphilus sp.]MDY3118434.1 biotin--[acetyl-CoA-carboxylase] ligase [Peptoniphilus sp.]
MKNKEYILETLKRADDYLSGEDLAKDLHISRAAIWQSIKSLRDDGYHIEAVTNRGYRLNENYEALDEKTIANRLEDPLKDVAILVKDKVDSTNDAIFREDSTHSFPSFSFMAAEEQTAGKGRVGHSFFSPFGTGLYLSTIIKEDACLDPGILTMAAAVSVKEALREQSEAKVEIKWVNDLYLNHKKICGILTEADFSGGRARYVVGIGINTHTPKDAFKKQALNRAGSLQEMVSRNQLAADIMNRLWQWIHAPRGAVLDAYRKYNFTVGKTVRFSQGDIEYTGKATAIDDDGSLVVQVADNTVRLSAGAISVQGEW